MPGRRGSAPRARSDDADREEIRIGLPERRIDPRGLTLRVEANHIVGLGDGSLHGDRAGNTPGRDIGGPALAAVLLYRIATPDLRVLAILWLQPDRYL
jgi:hypothetical protein